MRRQKACRLRIDFCWQVQMNLQQYRSNHTFAKLKVIDFIENLVAAGYRHFIIYIEKPTDLWVAELLLFLIPTYKPLDIVYSIGLWVDEDGMEYAWLEEICLVDQEIMKCARRIIRRRDESYDVNYRVKRLDFNSMHK